jgi:hypothetical protein
MSQGQNENCPGYNALYKRTLRAMHQVAKLWCEVIGKDLGDELTDQMNKSDGHVVPNGCCVRHLGRRVINAPI